MSVILSQRGDRIMGITLLLVILSLLACSNLRVWFGPVLRRKHIVRYSLFAFLGLLVAIPSAFAAPKKCVRDDSNGRIIITHSCNVKCLATAATTAAPDSIARLDYVMAKTPREITSRCKAEDGSPGVAGHGTSCFRLNTIMFVTPCNVAKDLYGDD